MINVREVIVVEGRYDKNTLSQVVDAVIIETGGFGIFNDKQKQKLLRKMAEARGLIVLTDSDGAGFVIRNFIKGCVDPKLVKHAYIPDVPGKERRKSAPGKEGKLGVEGMRPEVLITALRRAGATMWQTEETEKIGETGKTEKIGVPGGMAEPDETNVSPKLQEHSNPSAVHTPTEQSEQPPMAEPSDVNVLFKMDVAGNLSESDKSSKPYKMSDSVNNDQCGICEAYKEVNSGESNKSYMMCESANTVEQCKMCESCRISESGEQSETAPPSRERRISKADMYARGLTGTPTSRQNRAALIKSLDLPQSLTPTALQDILNAIMTREEFYEMEWE